MTRTDLIDQWLATEVRTMTWGPRLNDLTDPDERRECAEWLNRQIGLFQTWRNSTENGTETPPSSLNEAARAIGMMAAEAAAEWTPTDMVRVTWDGDKATYEIVTETP